MRISTKFSVAVHALLLVATEKEPCTSALIAGSVNTNPVVIRRIMSLLQNANLVSGIRGKSGYMLQKSPEAITLLDIYHAVAEEESLQLFNIHDNPNIECEVGASIQMLLEVIMNEAQSAMETVLNAVTLEHLIKKIPSS